MKSKFIANCIVATLFVVGNAIDSSERYRQMQADQAQLSTQKPQVNDGAISTFKIQPEMKLLSPMSRSLADVVDLKQQPCGGTSKGPLHFVTTPGSRNFIAWKVNHPAPQGNCTVRLGMGADEADFKVLFPLDKSANKDGSFPCGRTETNIEGKEFKFPKNFTCDTCTLQVEWTISSTQKTSVQQHHCGDVQVIGTEVEECIGQCQGGGVCMNGECKCRKGYSGAYCQYHDDGSASFGTIFFYFASFLFIFALIVGLFYGAIRIIKYVDEQKNQPLDDNNGNVNLPPKALPPPSNDGIEKITDNKSGEPTVKSSQYNQGGPFLRPQK